jgi:hypothetical protein
MRRPPSLAFALASLCLATAPHEARATGMQGHIYMAECGAELLDDGPLKTLLFDEHLPWLVNGAFFPDSGYTADDHDQGEIPHWESYVEAYVQHLRATYDSPLTDPAAAEHVAFLFGIAAHGITDSTFDTLLWPRSEEVDPGDVEKLDTAMDVFLVSDLARDLVPDVLHHEEVLSGLFTDVGHPIAPDSITGAMSTARIGIAAVTQLLSKGPEDAIAAHPWAHAAYLDPRTPGGYQHGARVTRRYYEELVKRLEGSADVDGLVIGTYPDVEAPLVTLDHTRSDARVLVFFGHGLDRASVNETSVVVRGPGGAAVPTATSGFRGDQWLNVIVLEPLADWLPDTTYELVVSASLVTLNGHSPSADVVIPFTTPCAGCEPSPALGTPEAEGGPSSLCALTDVRHPFPSEPEPTPEPEPEPEPTPTAAPQASSGCAMSPLARERGVVWLALAGLAWAGLGRARARRASRRVARE